MKENIPKPFHSNENKGVHLTYWEWGGEEAREEHGREVGAFPLT